MTGKLLDTYVLPAVISEQPLTADLEGQARLSALTGDAAQPPEPESVSPLPSTAQRVSGRTITLEDNPIGLASITLAFPEGEGQATLGLGLPDGSQVQWALGLDGVPRVNPGLRGFPMAALGFWASDDSFVLDLDYYSLRDADRLRAMFSGDAVTFDGFDVPLVGHLEAE